MKKNFLSAEEKHICSICGREYKGYGNNAEPVNNGRCCNECNGAVVIPTRFFVMLNANSRRL